MQDRIKQMAAQAGFDRFNDESVDPINFEPSPDGMWLLWDEDALARFARLIAEDCAKFVEPTPEHRMRPHEYLGEHEGVEMLDNLAEAIRARYAETKEP